MYNSQQASGSRGQTTRGQLVPSRGARPPTRAKYTRVARHRKNVSISYGSQPSTTDPSIADSPASSESAADSESSNESATVGAHPLPYIRCIRPFQPKPWREQVNPAARRITEARQQTGNKSFLPKKAICKFPKTRTMESGFYFPQACDRVFDIEGSALGISQLPGEEVFFFAIG
ncbi:hypothetical protein R3P38DRAFT_2793730 [Favolaschia claudopus]|uniref:Uncharacterized protein n=1 Tax=Favolaschia claudopus TaxID=2862362 RepID=A0AAW0ADW0_9AGAR